MRARCQNEVLVHGEAGSLKGALVCDFWPEGRQPLPVNYPDDIAPSAATWLSTGAHWFELRVTALPV